MPIKAFLRDRAKRQLRVLFERGQRVGLDILPRHFYSSIPSVADLRATTEWRGPSGMVGVAGAEPSGQLEWLSGHCTQPLRERLARGDIFTAACQANGAIGFGHVEALVLYCYIAVRRPRRVVQIGAGVSTAVVLRAAEETGHAVDLVCVDPFPTEFLRGCARAGKITLVEQPAQAVPLDVLTDIGEGNILFVDSTHTVKPGSEVNRLVLEVLPRLPVGSDVHFHDINWPYDYPRDLLYTNFFWAESTLLHAFLCCSPDFRISAALSMLHYAAPDALRQLVPTYMPAANDQGLQVGARPLGHFPSSVYLRRVADGTGPLPRSAELGG